MNEKLSMYKPQKKNTGISASFQQQDICLMHSTPYSQLAKIYDKVMAHVNYKMWAAYIKKLYQFADLKIEKIVDLSCGTGKHIRCFQQDKITFIGADYSTQMIAAAKSNLHLNNNASLLVNDARKIALKNKSTGVVLMLYDSINYLIDDSDIEFLFEEVNRILIPGGLFIFDFVTEAGLEKSFDGYYESDSWEDMAYERVGRYSKTDKLQYNTFRFFFNGEPFIEEHIQRIRAPREWKRFIQKSKMHLTAEFSNFSLLPPNRKSKRIHFVCKKDL